MPYKTIKDGSIRGFLTVLSKDDDYYKCRCVCGTIVNKTSALLDPRQRFLSCGCKKKEMHQHIAKQNIKYVDPKDFSVKYLYMKYKNSAKYRKREWKLSMNLFKEIIFSKCYYCGVLPYRSINGYKIGKKNKYPNRIQERVDSASILFNGVDRKDNDLGYVEENSVSCCTACNYAKRSQSYNEFIEWLERIGKSWCKKTHIENKTEDEDLIKIGNTLATTPNYDITGKPVIVEL